MVLLLSSMETEILLGRDVYSREVRRYKSELGGFGNAHKLL